MRITKYGHACLLLEEGEARLLIDPGAFSRGFEDLTGLDAIMITHQHQDHLVPETVKQLVAANPGVMVLADSGSTHILEEAGVAVQAMQPGDEIIVAGVVVVAKGGDHAVIHPDVPRIPNVGYLVAGSFFYPGDSFVEPGVTVAVLAAPAGAPWLKIAEAVDYVRSVKPKVAVPVHDAVLAMPDMNTGLMEALTKEQGIRVQVIPNGESMEFPG